MIWLSRASRACFGAAGKASTLPPGVAEKHHFREVHPGGHGEAQAAGKAGVDLQKEEFVPVTDELHVDHAHQPHGLRNGGADGLQRMAGQHLHGHAQAAFVAQKLLPGGGAHLTGAIPGHIYAEYRSFQKGLDDAVLPARQRRLIIFFIGGYGLSMLERPDRGLIMTGKGKGQGCPGTALSVGIRRQTCLGASKKGEVQEALPSCPGL